MITRYALFEGQVKVGQTEAFRAFVNENLVPLWTKFDGAQEVRVMFSEERDEGAPEFPLVLAISYPDRDSMARAMECDARYASKDKTAELVEQFFEGRIHHHVTTAQSFTL
jgi:ribosome-associated translation inhibitor RaiA